MAILKLGNLSTSFTHKNTSGDKGILALVQDINAAKSAAIELGKKLGGTAQEEILKLVNEGQVKELVDLIERSGKLDESMRKSAQDMLSKLIDIPKMYPINREKSRADFRSMIDTVAKTKMTPLPLPLKSPPPLFQNPKKVSVYENLTANTAAHISKPVQQAVSDGNPLPKPATSTPNAQQRAASDPLFCYKQQKMYEHMATAQMAAAVAHPIKTAKAVASTVCNLNPTTRTVCDKAKEIAKPVKETVKAALKPIKESVKSAVKPLVVGTKEILQKSGVTDLTKHVHRSYVYTRDHGFPNVVERELGISPELSRQYVSNALASAPILVPAGTVAYVAKRTFPGLVRACNSFMQPVHNAADRVVLAMSDILFAPQLQPIPIRISRRVTYFPPDRPLLFARDGIAPTFRAPICTEMRVIPKFPDVAETRRAIYQVLPSTSEKQVLAWSISENIDTVTEVFPNFFSLPREKAWAYALTGNTEAQLVIGKQWGSKSEKGIGNKVFKITHQGKNFIIKCCSTDVQHISSELLGFDLLESLSLKHLSLPKILGVGRYQNFVGRYQIKDENYFIAKSYVPGKTLDDLMKSVGAQKENSPLRNSLFNELASAHEVLGKGTGELQFKSLTTSRDTFMKTLNAEERNGFAWKISEVLDQANFNLSDIRYAHRIKETEKLESIVEKFRQTPTPFAYETYDIHGGQFIWQKNPARLHLVDADLFIESIDSLRRPRSIAGRDYWDYLTGIPSEAAASGLYLDEILKLKGAFAKGFSSEFTATLPSSTQQFFDIYHSINGIANLVESYCLSGEAFDKKIIFHFVRELNAKLK